MSEHNANAGKKSAARRTRGDVEARRLQICILLSLLVHCGLLVFLHESYLSCGTATKTLAQRRPEEQRRVVPDYHVQRSRRPDAQPLFATPVETKSVEEKKAVANAEPRERKAAVPRKAIRTAVEPVEVRPDAIRLKLRRDEAAESNRAEKNARAIERKTPKPRPEPSEAIALARANRPAEELQTEAAARASQANAEPQVAARRSPATAAEQKFAPSAAPRESAPRREAVAPPQLAPSARTQASRPTIELPGEAVAAEVQPGAPKRQNAELPAESNAASVAAHPSAGPSARLPTAAAGAISTGGATVEVPLPKFSGARAAASRGTQDIGAPSLENRQGAGMSGTGAIGRATISAGTLADADALASDESAEHSAGESGATAELNGPAFEPGESGVTAGLPSGMGIAAGPAGEGTRAFNAGGQAGVGLPSRGRAIAGDDVALSIPGRLSIQRSGGNAHGADIDGAVSEPTEAYQHRTPGKRGEGMKNAGGGEGTEAAVERGLDFLARMQFSDGHWSLDRLPPGVTMDDPSLGTMQSNTAATGLALLTYLGGGYTHLDQKHRDVVRRGVDWLARHQKADGDLFAGGSEYTWFYSHGIAAMALCEAFGMTQDPELREPAAKAVAFIVKTQHPTQGGWRYDVRPDTGQATDTDTSVTGWQLMALKSAQMAGLKTPESAFRKVGLWLDQAQSADNDGRYVYNPNAADTDEQRHGRAPSEAMTAEAMLMRMYLGQKRQDPRLIAGAEYLKTHLPDLGTAGQPTRDCYYWYYATQAMFQMQGDYWTAWNGRIQPLLQESQELSGEATGSWHPRLPVRDRWGEAGGRIYVTALHLLMLEVYYRHLPLFRLD